jgi:hypothetical protein
MDKIFLTIYILTLGFILISVILGLALEWGYVRIIKTSLGGIGFLIITGVIHGLTTLWC